MWQQFAGPYIFPTRLSYRTILVQKVLHGLPFSIFIECVFQEDEKLVIPAPSSMTENVFNLKQFF